jgi:hypothetical protein
MKKKDSKSKEPEEMTKEPLELAQIASKADLKAYLGAVRDKLFKEQAPPIFAMVAMKQVMSLDNIYDYLDSQSKETLQEIWVRLSQSGFHLRKPPLLFGDVDAAPAK